MLLINCPYCGSRNENEFRYGGEAHVAFPMDADHLDDESWGRYVFYRDNPAGPFCERWNHQSGCRRWFNAVRDTVTHEFLATCRLDDPPPTADARRAPTSLDPRPGAR